VEQETLVLNCSEDDQPLTLTFPHNGSWRDLLSNDQIAVTTNRYAITVPSNWGRIYHLKQ